MEYSLNHLKQLEAESIFILREAAASFRKPVMFYSIGKDSTVLLHLAQKAFAPAPLPWPLLHIDTGYEFKELLEFRDAVVARHKLRLLVERNTEPAAEKLGPEQSHTDTYIFYKKTKPLLAAMRTHQFDAGIGGSRREEEKSRAKERIFSVRSSTGAWDPKNQRPELWQLYNTLLDADETMRVFPMSNWTEQDIWRYIEREQIPISSLYFAQPRKVVKRSGLLISVDEYTQPVPGEEVKQVMCRYRTLGCAPSTGAVESSAMTITDILEELAKTKVSERFNRGIDRDSDSSLEKKKREGHF